MNILIFPSAPIPAALLDELAAAGHLVWLANPASTDEAIRAQAIQADLVVYQLGKTVPAGLPLQLRHLPGVLWLCEALPLDQARALAPWALGILAGAGMAPAPLLTDCPGPVLSDSGTAPGAALLRMAGMVQQVLPVRAAADELVALLRGWGASGDAIRDCGLDDSFDLFQA